MADGGKPGGDAILVRLPNWLGDCVMAMPAVRHLAESLPGIGIHLAGRRQFRDLFQSQPGVAGFVAAPDRGLGNLIRGLLAAPEGGRPKRFALGLLLANSLSAAVWLRKAGAGIRMGYDRDCRRLFLTHPVPCGGLEKSWHFVDYCLELARLAEAEAARELALPPRDPAPGAEARLPALAAGRAEREGAAELVREAGIAGPYAVVAPASAYGPVKDWPAAHYRRLIGGLNRDFSLPAILTGGAGQAGAVAELAEGLAAVNFAGRTPLPLFAGLLAGASLFVGGDSGGAHAAAALGVPTLVVFGATNPARTRPLGRAVRIFGGRGGDADLRNSRTREAAREILAGVSPESLLEAAGELLRSRPAGLFEPPAERGRDAH
ncbi:MAG: hypothetical protein LBU64_09695 [Planctomycetota bacterium]|jgi:heptosyltransferase-2|nr:hypothetical protein [Planctomycetota bacterium]